MARQGLLSLIDKPGKDPYILTSWRPLPLLNCDYKIFAKVIANRMQLVLPYIIHEDQTGFLKGRNIADNLMSLQNVISHCKKKRYRSYDYGS